MEEYITVVIKEPGRCPAAMLIQNRLEPLQETVGGYIEVVPWDDSHVMIINEEVKV